MNGTPPRPLPHGAEKGGAAYAVADRITSTPCVLQAFS
ncbi:hypothetical protein SACS_0080 [Parasaccharibacter apium]|uniref:Uncharacterized protein n=1 Tax=Parasaccharibacter apium TaxID=1510841 RepID=A0A7U7G467_9PROT|nr:hypothetical protein SACS_0080 [Parasaccharibacter apium]